MSAELMRSYLDILHENAFKQEYRLHLEQQGIEVTELMLDEGWKSKLAAAGLAGAVALGAMAPGQNVPTTPGPATTTSVLKHQHNKWDYESELMKKVSAFAQTNPEARQDLDKLHDRTDRVIKMGGDHNRAMTDGLQDLMTKYNIHPGHKGDPHSMPPVLK
jgi:hypothetical protein